MAQFGIVGFIQEATVDGTVAGFAAVPLPNSDPRAGGTLTVNGIKMLVPNNTFIQLPANAMTWQQLFDSRQSLSVGYTPARTNHVSGQSGLALADLRPYTHFPSFDVSVVGNIVPHPGNGTPQYIVGLIAPVAQQQLQGTFGIINYIDHTGTVLPGLIPGRFRVGGILGDPNTGALVEINDPVGRWGAVHSPDPRFQTDTANPTVCCENGYPVGIPLVAPRFRESGALVPAFVGDPDRPYTNRPLNGDPNFPVDPFLAIGAPLKTFNMPPPGTAGYLTDPRKALPLMVGDVVDVTGTLMKVDQRSTDNTAANMFISAHTVAADLGVFTAPGSQPCYVFVEAILMPTAEVRNQPQTIAGDPPTPVPLENTTRAVVVGFTTDPTQLVDIYAIDVHPTTGAETDRLIATVLPEPIGGLGRVRGRFRFTPSRAVGTFPATRDYVVKNQTGQLQLPAQAGTVPGTPGLMSGQYRLPNFDFLFAERTAFGAPTVPNDFNALEFLALGSGPVGGEGSGGPVMGRLDPWPGP
jgi:hypothetical protein